MKKSTSEASSTKPGTADNLIQAPIIEVPQLSEGELGKIQEILLGGQLRSSNEQIKLMQAFFAQQIQQLTEDHSQQLADLRRKIDDIQVTFTDCLDRKEREHQIQLQKVRESVGSAESAMTEKFGAVSESLASTRNDLTQKLDRTVADLRSTKVDRESMSNLFSMLATELANRDAKKIL